MKFAFVDGERRQAEKGLSGICVGCEQPMIPKCGPIKVKHWAHKSQCECDHWWENETEWHRTWKNNFPVECQEVRCKDKNGEWHIADVRTKQGYILEFQHSFLNPMERQARNSFYGSNLIWVVDGLKRSKDWSQFYSILKSATPISKSIPLIRLSSVLVECSLLREWSDCNVPVFFDFGSELPLWCLLPKSSKSALYVGPFLRQKFVELHNGVLTKEEQSFSELMKILSELVFAYENPQQQIVHQQRPTRMPTRSTMLRQITIPHNPSPRYLYYLNHSPRRRCRL